MVFGRPTAWIPEHDEALRKHLKAMLSFSEAAAAINREFGTDYSRNAAIGRANRLGLKSRCPKSGGLHAKSRPVRLETRVAAKPQPAIRQFACDETGLRIADVVPRHLNLLELGLEHCHWPYGDRDYTFCGCEAFDGGPYCEPHAALSISERNRAWEDRPTKAGRAMGALDQEDAA